MHRRTSRSPITQPTPQGPPTGRVHYGSESLATLGLQMVEHFLRHKPEPASFPAMASKVIDLVEHPDVDIARLAHLIERDPAICAAVLAVANSAANRRSNKVQAARTAIGLLGLKRVANIAVGVACRSLFDVELRVEYELFPQWWNRLFHASMAEAFTSSFVAIERSRSASEGIFLGAMMRNIGSSLGLRSLAAQVMGGSVTDVPDDRAIESLLRQTRIEIGVEALTNFDLPETTIFICRHQADMHVPKGPQWFDVQVIRLVSSLNELRMGTLDTAEPLRLLLDAAAALEFDRTSVLAVAHELSEHAAQVEVLFSTTDGSDETGFFELLERTLA